MGRTLSGGNGHSTILSFARAPERVVSLVPSMTESLFDLGAGGSLVGVTEFCRPPEAHRGRLAVVGGTRTAEVAAILALRPDLVLANQEENTRETVESLEAHGAKVWVTFPRSVDEAIRVLWALVRLFRVPHSEAIIQALELSLAWTAGGSGDPVRVFVPIWEGQAADSMPWWMTVNRETYVHDLLAVCGGENVFADRERRHPLETEFGRTDPEPPDNRDVRYPRVSEAEILERRPELILLPSEPYAYGEGDVDRFHARFGPVPVRTVDGSLLTWHGTRLGKALALLPALIREGAPGG